MEWITGVGVILHPSSFEKTLGYSIIKVVMLERQKITVKSASEQLGVSVDTLRRLCNSGLIPHVRRNHLGFRVLEAWQINYARTMLGLKLSELKNYTSLYRRGAETLPERKAILETQKRQLWQELEDRKQGIDFIERQIELIDQELK